MRLASRKDANQGVIVSTLRQLGFYVLDCSGVGRVIPGFPDLILARRGALHLVEVKTGTGELRAEQTIFHKALEPFGIRIPVLRTVDDAVAFAGGRLAA